MPKQNNKEKPKSIRANIAKYSGLSFQMAAIVFGGVFGGLKLDQWLEFQFPLFTLVFTLISIVLAIYFAIKDFF